MVGLLFSKSASSLSHASTRVGSPALVEFEKTTSTLAPPLAGLAASTGLVVSAGFVAAAAAAAGLVGSAAAGLGASADLAAGAGVGAGAEPQAAMNGRAAMEASTERREILGMYFLPQV